MDAPQESFYTEAQKSELTADVRGLLHEYPFLQNRDADKVCRMLVILRGVVAPTFEVGAVLEALRVDDEVLA